MKKIIIDLQGVISKKNGKEFTEEEYDQLTDLFIEFVESKDCIFGGGFGFFTDREFMDINKVLNDTSQQRELLITYSRWLQENKTEPYSIHHVRAFMRTLSNKGTEKHSVKK